MISTGAVAELTAAARKLRFATAEAGRQPSGPMSHVKAAAAELDRAVAEATGKAPPVGDPRATGFVVQLQGYAAEPSGRALIVLSQIFIALLFAFFLLAAGDTFRRKVARIAGASLARRRVTVEVLNEIDSQFPAYMLTLLIANVLIALAAWAGLALLGGRRMASGSCTCRPLDTRIDVPSALRLIMFRNPSWRSARCVIVESVSRVAHQRIFAIDRYENVTGPNGTREVAGSGWRHAGCG